MLRYDRNNMKELYDSGYNDREIAELIGASKCTVIQWRNSRGLKPMGKVRENKFLELYNEGYDDAEIADITDYTVAVVRYWRRKCGYPSHYRIDPVTNKRGKLRKDHAEIYAQYKAMYDKGMRDKDIAEVVNRHRSSVYVWRRKYNLPSNSPPPNVSARVDTVKWDNLYTHEQKKNIITYNDDESLYCDKTFIDKFIHNDFGDINEN